MRTSLKIILFFILALSPLYAITLDTDTFDTNQDGWSFTNGGWDPANQRIWIDRDDSGTKTYSFSAYPNAIVTFTLDATVPSSWEGNNDALEIEVDGVRVIDLGMDNETRKITFRAALNGSGDTTISITPNGSADDEDVYIDNVIVTYTPFIVPETEENDDCSEAQMLMDTSFVNQHFVTLTGGAVLGDDADIFAFNVKQAGDITITLNNNDGSNHKMEYGLLTAPCGIPASPIVLSAKNSVSFSNPVSKDTIYYLYIKSNGADGNRDVDYDFSARFTPSALNYTCPNPKQFGKAFSKNDLGNMLLIGNTNLCAGTSYAASDSTCYNPGTLQNNDLTLINVNADTLDPTTFNSTSAELTMPPGATVLWAGLYWQGHHIGGTVAEKEAGRYIKIRHENDAKYTSLLAKEMHWVYRDDGNSYHYQGHADITDFIRSRGNGDIWVADLTTELFNSSNGGQYGAWSIAIAYQDTQGALRNISIYDGFLGMRETSETFDASCTGDDGLYATRTINLGGFFTPTSGDINSTFFVFAAEGDRPTVSETLQLDGNEITDTNNPASNQFNSTITRDGAHVTESTTPSIYPSYSVNSLGIDIDTYDVSSLIQNGQSDTNVTLGSTTDYYYPGLFAFSTDLYKPLVCYTEQVYINGSAYNGTSLVSIGDTITMEVNVTNQGATDALGVSVENRLQSEFGYNPESLGIDDVPVPSEFVAQTDAEGDDEADYNSTTKTMTFYLGIGADGTGTGTGGTLSFNDITRFDYNVTLFRGNDQNSTTNIYYVSYTDSDLGITFSGVPMPECTGSGSGINIGPYNWSGDGIDALDDPAVPGVIQTKVVDKPFPLYAVNIVNNTPSAWTSVFPFPAFMYLTDDTCSEPTASDEPFALAFIQQNDTNGRAYQLSDGTSDPVFTRAQRTARIMTSYYDFGPLFGGETNINCTENSSTNGATGKPHDGVPSCLISNNPTENANIIEEFPEASSCYGAGGPCQASTQISDLVGTALGRFANDYGCLMCITESEPQWTCSSDNFSIRPDRFHMDLTTISPMVAPTISFNTLRSGQGYDIDTFAYTFGTTTPALDYNQGDTNLTTFANTRLPNGTIDTTLAGTSWINAGTFIDGNSTITPINFSFNDVGKITFDLNDTNWAAVDSDDTPFSDYVIHGDVNVTFIPWDFNITAATLTNNNDNGTLSFTYFSDDTNMSAKIPLTLRAQNMQGGVTQNYADTLYDKPITMSVTIAGFPGLTPIIDGIVDQDLPFTSGQTVIPVADVNVLSFNFDRQTNVPLNPTFLTGGDVNATVSDTDNVTGQNAENLDGNITFYYGRLHAPRTRIAGNAGTATFYYEIYCFGTDAAGTVCDPALRDAITGGLLSEDDIRWFQNTNHTNADGSITTTTQKNGFLNITQGIINNAAVTTIPYAYSGNKGFPYKTTMQIDNSSWLLWNRFVPDPLLLNEFELEFNQAGTWSGTDLSGANVDSNASTNTSRRIQW